MHWTRGKGDIRIEPMVCDLCFSTLDVAGRIFNFGHIICFLGQTFDIILFYTI